MLPVLPLNVSKVLFVPVHTVVAPLIEPATLNELTVAITAVLVDDTQPVVVFIASA